MYLEYDWTFDVYRARFGAAFTDIHGERSFGTMREARDACAAAGLRVGKKTDSRTWRIEAAKESAQ